MSMEEVYEPHNIGASVVSIPNEIRNPPESDTPKRLVVVREQLASDLRKPCEPFSQHL